MGFDLYGENPVMRNISEDAYPVYNKYAGMDFKEQMEIFKENKKIAAFTELINTKEATNLEIRKEGIGLQEEVTTSFHSYLHYTS